MFAEQNTTYPHLKHDYQEQIFAQFKFPPNANRTIALIRQIAQKVDRTVEHFGTQSRARPSRQLWKTIASNILLHNSKSISNFYYFPQSNSLYFSAFRSVSFLRGFRGGFQCNDISIQFRPHPSHSPYTPDTPIPPHAKGQANRGTKHFFCLEADTVLRRPIAGALLWRLVRNN